MECTASAPLVNGLVADASKWLTYVNGEGLSPDLVETTSGIATIIPVHNAEEVTRVVFTGNDNNLRDAAGGLLQPFDVLVPFIS